MRSNEDKNIQKQATAVVTGGLLSLIITFCLILITSVFVQNGTLPDSGLGWLVMLLAFVGSFAGAYFAIKKSNGKTLIMGIGSSAVFFLALLVCRLLLFDYIEGGIAGVCASVFLGGICSGLLGGKLLSRK